MKALRGIVLVGMALLSGAAYAQAPEGKTRSGLISTMQLVLKSYDSDSDGRLSRTEWTVMVDGLIATAPEERSADYRGRLMAEFDSEDTDHDDYLNLEELLRDRLAAFACMDSNDDGILEAEEIVAKMGNSGKNRDAAP